MTDLVLTTFDWVPDVPRGYVRDLRVRWALEEAGMPYRVESVPFRERGAEHFARQPFGQVPWLQDGDISIFESGAILLHVGEKSETLMPTNPTERAKVLQWLIAGLNSIEMASVPWSLYKFLGDTEETPGKLQLDAFLKSRLDHMETILAKCEWLTDQFSIADILMVDALRLVARFNELADRPACSDYIARAERRPAFAKAYADQMAHFARAD